MRTFCGRGICLFSALSLAMTAISCTSAYGGAHNDIAGNTTENRGDFIPISPNAQLYSYFILVGIARGAIATGHLQRQDLHSLLHLDQQTRAAILKNMHHPTMQTTYDVDQKLEAYLSAIPR